MPTPRYPYESGALAKASVAPPRRPPVQTGALPLTRGVAVADGGMVYVFERAEGDKDYSKRERSFKIENNAVKIKNLAVSPSEEQLVCTLANCQAYVLPLSNTDILKSDEMNFELLSQAR